MRQKCLSSRCHRNSSIENEGFKNRLLTGREVSLRFSQKQIFNKADSFRYNIKLDRNTLKIKNKIKQKISDKFTCEVCNLK